MGRPTGSGVYIVWPESRTWMPNYGEDLYALWTIEVSDDTIQAAEKYAPTVRGERLQVRVEVIRAQGAH